MEASHVFLTIAAASAAIISTKLLSLVLLVSKREPNQFVQDCLSHTPGTMISALIIPDLIALGPVGWMAAGVATATAAVTRNMLATVLAGAGAAFIIRFAGFTG